METTQNKDSRNRKILDSFVKYCEEHPQERFWQALRNWSRFNFIYVSLHVVDNPKLVDTFYFD
jgi:hypothetical protein